MFEIHGLGVRVSIGWGLGFSVQGSGMWGFGGKITERQWITEM